MSSVVSYLTPALSARPAHRPVVMAGRVMLTTLRCFFLRLAHYPSQAAELPSPPAPHATITTIRGRGAPGIAGSAANAGGASCTHTHVYSLKKRTHSLIHASVRKHKTTSHSYKNAHILKFTVVYTRTRPISHYNDKKTYTFSSTSKYTHTPETNTHVHAVTFTHDDLHTITHA